MSETDDFKQQVKPAKRRSKFDPQLAGIRELQREGYSLEQICEWLWLKFQIGDSEKKAPSSKQVLSAYLHRRKDQGTTSPSPSPSAWGQSEENAAPGTSTQAGGKTVKIGKFEVTRPKEFRQGSKADVKDLLK